MSSEFLKSNPIEQFQALGGVDDCVTASLHLLWSSFMKKETGDPSPHPDRVWAKATLKRYQKVAAQLGAPWDEVGRLVKDRIVEELGLEGSIPTGAKQGTRMGEFTNIVAPDTHNPRPRMRRHRE